jgi:hypothetical protein
MNGLTGYITGTTDLSGVFKGYISGQKQPNSGFITALGQDISQLFQRATSPSEQISYNTNFYSTLSGTGPLKDLKEYFMDINYVFPSITFTGATSSYTFTVSGVTYQTAIFDGTNAANNGSITGKIIVANAPSGYIINYLLVGGGGGAGSGSAESSQAGSKNLPGGGGGGGAGDIICSSTSLLDNSYNISVPGKVDGGQANPSSDGNTGGTTSFTSSFSALGGGRGGGAGNNGTGGGPGNGNGPGGTGYSTGNGGGGAYGYVTVGFNQGQTYDGGGGGSVKNLSIPNNVMSVNNGTVTFYNSSSQQITYNIGGGGGGGSSSTKLVSGGSSAGGAGGNMPDVTTGGSGNGFDGGFGGGGGGGGAQDNAPPYGAGNGGRGGPGLAIIWWEVPQ